MKRLKYILLLGIVSLMVSCVIIGEDTDCSEMVKIRFSTSAENRSTRAADYTQIKQIDLFVFDKDGFFVGKWGKTFDAMPTDFEIEIPIGIGTYTFVAWGNMNNMFMSEPSVFKPKETNYSDIKVILKNNNGKVINIPHSLIFGDLKNAEVNGRENQSFTIFIKNNTYKINLRTIGLPASTDQYSMTIKDSNGVIKFDNSLAPSSELIYTTFCEKDGNGQLAASLTTMRLYEPTSTKPRPTPYLTIKNETTNDVIFPFGEETGDLIELITRLNTIGQSVYFDRVNEYTITLTFDVNLKVTININGWDVPVKSENDLDNDF